MNQLHAGEKESLTLYQAGEWAIRLRGKLEEGFSFTPAEPMWRHKHLLPQNKLWQYWATSMCVARGISASLLQMCLVGVFRVTLVIGVSRLLTLDHHVPAQHRCMQWCLQFKQRGILRRHLSVNRSLHWLKSSAWRRERAKQWSGSQNNQFFAMREIKTKENP